MTQRLTQVVAAMSASLFVALSGPAGAQPITLKLGHVLPGGDHPYQQGAMKFADIVQSRTHGRIKVDT